MQIVHIIQVEIIYIIEIEYTSYFIAYFSK